MAQDIDHDLEIPKLRLEIQRRLTQMYAEAAQAFSHMHTYAQAALHAEEQLLEHLQEKEEDQ